MSENNNTRTYEDIDYKYCSKCGQRFPIDNFYKQGRNGRVSKCKQCVSETISNNYKHRPTIFEQMTEEEKYNVCVGLLTGMLMRDIVKMTRMSQPTLAKLIREGKFLDGVSFEYYDSDEEERDGEERDDEERDGTGTDSDDDNVEQERAEQERAEQEKMNLFRDLKRLNNGVRSLKRREKRENATDELPESLSAEQALRRGESLAPPKLVRQNGCAKIERAESKNVEKIEKVEKVEKKTRARKPRSTIVEPQPVVQPAPVVIPVLPLSQLPDDAKREPEKKEPAKRGRPRKNNILVGV